MSTVFESPNDLSQFRREQLLEYFWKCKDSDEMVNRLSSRAFASTARTKSSLPQTAGRPAARHARYLTFVTLPQHPITRNIFTVYFTYLTISAGFTTLALKKNG